LLAQEFDDELRRRFGIGSHAKIEIVEPWLRRPDAL
jgi:hypothetical protein